VEQTSTVARVTLDGQTLSSLASCLWTDSSSLSTNRATTHTMAMMSIHHPSSEHLASQRFCITTKRAHRVPAHAVFHLRMMISARSGRDKDEGLFIVSTAQFSDSLRASAPVTSHLLQGKTTGISHGRPWHVPPREKWGKMRLCVPLSTAALSVVQVAHPMERIDPSDPSRR
jgi:hypothetical protein